MTASKIMIYGAYGYTGRQVAEEAARQGREFVAAGRKAEAVGEIAAEYGMESRVFTLDDSKEIARQLADIDIVISAAGPFKTTAPRVLDACVASRTHYLDTCGELPVFEYAESLDAAAARSGVMLVPGAGWDVVASDGIGLHAARRVKDPVTLRIGVWHNEHFMRPRASSYTLNDILDHKVIVRRNEKLVELDEPQPRVFDVGSGLKTFYPYRMADVICSWRSTGVPNIEVYTGADLSEVKKITAEEIARMPIGPDAEQRAKTRSYTFAEATGAGGEVVTSLHDSVSGFEFTAIASVLIAQKIMEGEVYPGFQSPSSAYGTRLIEEIRGTKITDLT